MIIWGHKPRSRFGAARGESERERGRRLAFEIHATARAPPTNPLVTSISIAPRQRSRLSRKNARATKLPLPQLLEQRLSQYTRPVQFAFRTIARLYLSLEFPSISIKSNFFQHELFLAITYAYAFRFFFLLLAARALTMIIERVFFVVL